MYSLAFKARKSYCVQGIYICTSEILKLGFKTGFKVQLHNIYLYLWRQVENTKWILNSRKIGVKSPYLEWIFFFIFIKPFFTIELIFNWYYCERFSYFLESIKILWFTIICHNIIFNKKGVHTLFLSGNSKLWCWSFQHRFCKKYFNIGLLGAKSEKE